MIRIYFTSIFCAVFIAFALPAGAGEGNGGYIVAASYTPVLNSCDFSFVFGGPDGKTLSLDSSGLLRELEFIAFPGTVLRVHGRCPGTSILRVATADYPYDKNPLYIDERFGELKDYFPGDRKKILPPANDIIRKLRDMQGQSYLWGGNTSSGVREMTDFYQPAGAVSEENMRIWELKGVDCSGLLYLASGGFTPRNTSSLVSFGHGVAISGAAPETLVEILKPLDLIVWVGHVIIVLDENKAIESTQGRGVHVSPLAARLEELAKTRAPADESGKSTAGIFLVRRWINL